MMIDPTAVAEEVIDLNDDLSIHYTSFRNGYVFTRPAGSWRTWRALPFVEPVENEWIKQNHLDGVEFGCCEHVSVVLSGNATYTLLTSEGAGNYLWQRGSHNVDNGHGYLPTQTFTRTFRNDFSMCCVIQPIRGLTDQPVYTFEILIGPQVLTRDVFALHFCTGSRAKQTWQGVTAGTPIDVADSDILIAIYTGV
jgi:hypothetical protein